MKTRIVYTKFWTDGYISSLTRAEKLTFIYLITNEHIGLSGIYELPDNRIIFETGLTQTEWQESKQKFQEDKKFFFYKDYVKINNVEKYQQFSGEKNEIAKKRELELINKEIIDTLLIGYGVFSDTPNNHKSIISNHKSLKRVVKGEYSTIDSLTEVELSKIAEEYNVPMAFVISKLDDLKNYCESKGRVYKNYLATLKNFVKKDAVSIRREENGKSKITVITPDPNWNT